jgi:hypothetical protein
MTRRLGLSRSQLLLAFFLAIILVVLAFLQNQPQNVEPYDPDAANSSGLRALVLWLEELGYPVTINHFDTAPSHTTALYWVHSGASGLPDRYSERTVQSLSEWVESGGTLVLVGPAANFAQLIETFGGEQIETIAGMVSDVHQVQPFLPDTPSNWNTFFAANSLEFDEDRAIVPILAHTNGDPVVALQFAGKGAIWHLTEDFALTNLNLRDERVASLLPAILRTVPEGAPVAFSTQHLSTFDPLLGETTTISTLQDWLYTTPFGQGTLLLVATLFVYLLLQGRRLGPALPAPTATRPREAAEYVKALAGLQRRIRQPRVVAEHHHQRFKSAVGRLAQLPADLPDGDWLAQLRRADLLSEVTLDQVSELLSGYADIENKADDEAALIDLVRDTDALLATLPRANRQLVR